MGYLRLLVTGLLLLSLGSVLTACSSGNSTSPSSSQPQEEDFIYHRIKYSGETVAIISAWYTRSAKNWPEIVDSNPKMVPSRLRLGDLVRIPKRLVSRFQSMPQEFVSSFKSGVNKDSSTESKPKPESVPESNTNTQSGSDDYTIPSADVVQEEMPASEPVQESAPEVSFDSPPAVEEPMAGSDSSMPSSKEPEPPVLQDVAPPVVEKLPPAPAPENDENQKIREQLMQELLQ